MKALPLHKSLDKIIAWNKEHPPGEEMILALPTGGERLVKIWRAGLGKLNEPVVFVDPGPQEPVPISLLRSKDEKKKKKPEAGPASAQLFDESQGDRM